MPTSLLDVKMNDVFRITYHENAPTYVGIVVVVGVFIRLAVVAEVSVPPISRPSIVDLSGIPR